MDDLNHISYSDYGGRGIKVSEEWLIFDNFIRDLGNRPSEEHSLERINNELGYCKENCKWATCEEQSNNRRNVKLIEYKGKKLSLSQWCRELNIPLRRARMRMIKKWPLDKVFHTDKFSNKVKIMTEEEHIKEHQNETK